MYPMSQTNVTTDTNTTIPRRHFTVLFRVSRHVRLRTGSAGFLDRRDSAPAIAPAGTNRAAGESQRALDIIVVIYARRPRQPWKRAQRRVQKSHKDISNSLRSQTGGDSGAALHDGAAPTAGCPAFVEFALCVNLHRCVQVHA